MLKLSLHSSLTVVSQVILVSLSLCGCDKSKLGRLQLASNFTVPRRIALQISDYCPTNGWDHQDLFVKNVSYVMTEAGLEPDTNRFGVPDSQGGGKEWLSTGSHYSGLVLHYLGISPSEIKNLPACSSDLDTDQDGLNDCEEALISSNPNAFDTDGNGIPDLMNVYGGMSLTNGASSKNDTDGDSISNYEEIKKGTPLRAKNTEAMENYAVQYELVPAPQDTLLCYKVNLSIPIVDVANDNMIRLLVSQRNHDGRSRMLNVAFTIPYDIESTEVKRKFNELFPDGNQ